MLYIELYLAQNLEKSVSLLVDLRLFLDHLSIVEVLGATLHVAEGESH